MHLAFKQAVPGDSNQPLRQADRPKAVQYIGTLHNSAEIKQLLECRWRSCKDTVILTAYYGLREAVLDEMGCDRPR